MSLVGHAYAYTYDEIWQNVQIALSHTFAFFYVTYIVIMHSNAVIANHFAVFLNPIEIFTDNTIREFVAKFVHEYVPFLLSINTLCHTIIKSISYFIIVISFYIIQIFIFYSIL